MRSKLLGYSHGERFVHINQDNYLCGDELYLNDLQMAFRYTNSGSTFKLNPDDVLYINGYGIVQRVYDSETHNFDLLTTLHCNSNCIMCPISEHARRSNECGYHEWLKRLIHTLPSTIEHICITGGEPTLLDDKLFDLIDMLAKKTNVAAYQLLTNGRSCGNSSFCQKLVHALPNNTLYGIPLHASNMYLHDRIARVNGAFMQTTQGIRNLVKYGGHVEIRIVVSKLNIANMDGIAAYIIRYLKGIFCVTFMGIETMGNAVKNFEDVWVDYQIAAKSFENAIEMLLNGGVDVMIYNYPLCYLSERYWSLARRSITENKVMYCDECRDCAVKEACSGFFASTFRVTKPRVYPVVINDD